MQKILVVINASQPQSATVDFACQMAAFTQSSLTGLFVENPYTKETEEPSGGGAKKTSEPGEPVENPVNSATDKAVNLFVNGCASHRVATTALVNKGEPIQEVLRESRYADLLIVEPGIDFYGGEDEMPSHFTREILARSECPVLLAPEKAADTEEVVFCYDGSASSVYAVKQFTYLLPQFKNTRLLLLEVVGSNAEDGADDRQQMLEWLGQHYKEVVYKALPGNADDELFTYFFMKEKKLVVMGSYGRSALSHFFRKSAADALIRSVDLPVFITHFNR